MLYLVMSIQQMEKLEDANELVETYLVAIWLKFNIEDKNAEFHSDEMCQKIQETVDESIKEANKSQKRRTYLGASSWENRVLVGYNIDLWVKNLIRKVSSVLSFYVYFNLDIRLRTWHMVGWLRHSFDLRSTDKNGEQFGFSIADDQVKGHIDGVICVDPMG